MKAGGTTSSDNRGHGASAYTDKYARGPAYSIHADAANGKIIVSGTRRVRGIVRFYVGDLSPSFSQEERVCPSRRFARCILC